MFNKIIILIYAVLSTSCSFADSYNDSLGRDAAKFVLNHLSEDKNSTTNFKIDETVSAFKRVLENSEFIQQQQQRTEELDAETMSRQQAEKYYLKNVATLPLYQHSDSGYLYTPITRPRDPNSPKPTGADIATFSIKAESHEGIVLINTEGKLISRKIYNMPRGLAWAILDMRKGEEIEVVLPSWVMFGGKQYLNIPPYSTIIANIMLKDFNSQKSENPQAEKKLTVTPSLPTGSFLPHADVQSLEKNHQ